MTPDYALSNLHADQAALWFYLRVDVILAEIFAGQPERRKFPLALGASAQLCGPHCAFEAAGGTQRSKTGSRLLDVGLGQDEVN